MIKAEKQSVQLENELKQLELKNVLFCFLANASPGRCASVLLTEEVKIDLIVS
jgi:hypothetical protein